MQQDYAESLLRSGIIEAKAGVRSTARRYLERAVYASDNGHHDTMAEAWFWLAEVADEPGEKRKALENALSHNLNHLRARRALAILDGKIRAEELVDPERLPAQAGESVNVEAERFMCPKCGGRMSFAPDGQSLVCDFCAGRECLEEDQTADGEEDFLIAMHTLRGHTVPLDQQVFGCGGCGAQFLLPATLISASCAYCGSPHVVSVKESRQLITPDAVVPHAFDEKQLAAYLDRWLKKAPLDGAAPGGLQGLYLPAWTFAIGGMIGYTGEVVEERTVAYGSKTLVLTHVQDTIQVRQRNVLVPATRKLARVLAPLLPGFDLEASKSFDPRYLADWPAELYDVPVDDASLEARSQAFKQIKSEVKGSLQSTNILSISSAGMTIESFRLVLVPVWLARIHRDEPVLINGQNGAVAGEKAGKKGLLDWLADVLED
jgi:predicted RNA-binding Zn-ribbon protein involved in translation (DUF1610 family)